jgi:L-methionine (R)-S-oxide reductase
MAAAIEKWDIDTTRTTVARTMLEASPPPLLVDITKVASAVPETLPLDRVEALRKFKIPRITEDGTCSRPDDLEKEPFDLLGVVFKLGSADSASLISSAVVRRLAILQSVMDELATATSSEWVGVYRAIPSPPEARPSSVDERALVKEAYVGAPSRPFFPLTTSFAEHSNNSTVAMTRQTVIIHDVRKISPDEPYYTCDGKVRSELCAPILDAAGNCIGIIDAEAWRPNHFTPTVIAQILDACEQLGKHNLFVHMLEGT